MLIFWAIDRGSYVVNHGCWVTRCGLRVVCNALWVTRYGSRVVSWVVGNTLLQLKRFSLNSQL